MRPRHRSSSEPAPSRAPGIVGRRQLVLVLSGRREPAEILPFTLRSRHRSDHCVVVDPPGIGPDDRRTAGIAEALGSWRRIGAELSSACLGLVAEAGAAAMAVADILAHGFEDGSLPGAVALLGYHPGIEAACRRPAGGPGSEGPPIVVFLPADDPGLAGCASACRRMRTLGFDIRLEIRDPAPTSGRVSDIGALGADLMAEMDAFFEAHLEPCFPNMPRAAS